jgi:Tfp pilus assembly protein PilZ
MSFADRAALERELDQNLRHGRAFLQQASEVPVLSECVLVLIHPEHGEELRLSAQVVMVNPSGPMCGMGIALRSFGPNDVQRVQEFACSQPANDVGHSPSGTALRAVEAADLAADGGEAASPGGTLPPGEADEAARPIAESCEVPILPRAEDAAPAAEQVAPDLERQQLTAAEAEDAGAGAPREDAAEAEAQAESRESEAPLGDEELSLCAEAEDGLEEQELALDENASESRKQIELQVGNKQEKLRNLNAAQQLKLARTGELAERIALERLYGKHVWEALLHNPRLSLPEVARIARKGTVPKPLLDVILENNAWLKAAAVRRALLSNPKLSGDAILKLLRLTPKHELKILEKSTAYGAAVREAARKLLKQ